MSNISGDQGDKPFIGIVTGKHGNELRLSQLPEGFMWVIHESASKETQVLGVYKIRLKALDMKCVCGRPDCTLRIRARLEVSGHHPTYEERGG